MYIHVCTCTVLQFVQYRLSYLRIYRLMYRAFRDFESVQMLFYNSYNPRVRFEHLLCTGFPVHCAGSCSWGERERPLTPTPASLSPSPSLPLPRSLTLSLTHSLTHHSLTHSLTHPPTHSLTHSLTHSFTHSLARSLTHPPTHSLSALS